MKELSEHLRTVHFTVLVVALILIAASQIEGRRPLEKAAADAEAISRLRQKWGETAAKIRQAADSAVPAISIQVGGHPGIALSNGTNYRLRTPRGAVFNFSLTREDPRSSLGIGTELVLAKWIYFSSDAADGEMPLNRFPKPWSTLKQFLTVWDDLLLGRAVFLPFQLMQDDSNRCGVIGPHEFLDGRDTAVVDPNPHRVGDFWELRPILKSEIGAPVCQFFPTNVKALKLDFVEIYSAVLGRSIGWGERTSSEEFPKIIEAAKYFEDAPIDRLATALRSRANTDVERIDLFRRSFQPMLYNDMAELS